MTGNGSAPYRAAECLYHNFLTGLILRTLLERGKVDTVELVFRLFRKQQEEKFLPGLEKLGLTHLPDAVKCAQYHYLSNALGHVNVEYMYESDRKAWVRYPPPRWIWDGTAICSIPTEVSSAMLRGWHSHNGVSLQNARLGFVCTKQTVDGQPGLEGYFREFDHILESSERLQFAPDDESPTFDPEAAPRLEAATWPEDRVWKALRNYAMEYVRNILHEMVNFFGPEETGRIGRATGKLIGMQYYAEIAELLAVHGRAPEDFGRFLTSIGKAQGDDTEWVEDGGAVFVRQSTWRLERGIDAPHPAIFEAWNGLWEGALSVHDRRLRLDVRHSFNSKADCIEWAIQS